MKGQLLSSILIILLIMLIFFRLSFLFVIKRTKSQREKALKSGRNYLNKCLEGIIKNVTFTMSNNPRISVIVPVYNSQKTIKSALSSIQNQNMIDIEIILINDNSKDNSIEIIENIQKKDPRIILINNKKNMGILYSRCLGVLKSRGNFILNLDHDDMFFDEDVFDKLYKSTEKGIYDIISFMEVDGDNYYIGIEDMKDGPCTYHPNNLIIRQPELSYYTLFKNEGFAIVDIQIWGKLFKTQIYKSAIDIIGAKRFSVFNALNEDMIVLFSICNVAKSYKYIRKYGLFHFSSNSTASKTASREHCMNMELLFCDVIFDSSINISKKYAAIIAIRLRTMPYFSLSNLQTKRYLFYILNKIINSKFVEEKYKKKLISEYNDYGLLNI
jgi:glycosyltransferase involved in cell wall biosynthesis